MLGTFGTSVTAGTSSNGITIGASTINRNTAAGSLAINAGIGTSTVLGLTAGGSVTITAPATSVSGALSLQNLTTQGAVCNSAAGLISTSATTCPGAAPSFMLGGVLHSANFNSVADQAITITSPTPNYRINSIFFTNASTSMTTAAGGMYTAAAKGGAVVIPATTVYTTLNGSAINSAGSAFGAGLNAANTNTAYNVSTLFLSLTTAQGAAATADVYVYIVPLP